MPDGIHGDLPDDALTRALYRVWCAATDSATSPDSEGDDDARERYRLSIMAEARKELTGLSGAAIAMTAMHDFGRRNLRTTAVLRVWRVARQRGIANTPAAGGPLGTEDCDALSDAALDAVFDRLAQWAAEPDGEEPDPSDFEARLAAAQAASLAAPPLPSGVPDLSAFRPIVDEMNARNREGRP